MSTKRTHLVEVFGSLLNFSRREEAFKKGKVTKIGVMKRRGWKLSFDRKSTQWGEAVLNFVFTGNQEDVYYTTIFEVDDTAYNEVLENEMGPRNAEKWRKGENPAYNSYRPKLLDSKFGKTDVFIIPQEEREPTEAHLEDRYASTVRIGIKNSYKKCPRQLAVNLKALERAIEESKTIETLNLFDT